MQHGVVPSHGRLLRRIRENCGLARPVNCIWPRADRTRRLGKTPRGTAPTSAPGRPSAHLHARRGGTQPRFGGLGLSAAPGNNRIVARELDAELIYFVRTVKGAPAGFGCLRREGPGRPIGGSSATFPDRTCQRRCGSAGVPDEGFNRAAIDFQLDDHLLSISRTLSFRWSAPLEHSCILVLSKIESETRWTTRVS